MKLYQLRDEEFNYMYILAENIIEALEKYENDCKFLDIPINEITEIRLMEGYLIK